MLRQFTDSQSAPRDGGDGEDPALSRDHVFARGVKARERFLHALQDRPGHRATLLGWYHDRQHLWSEHG
jgi:hypothetical protein